MPVIRSALFFYSLFYSLLPSAVSLCLFLLPPQQQRRTTPVPPIASDCTGYPAASVQSPRCRPPSGAVNISSVAAASCRSSSPGASNRRSYAGTGSDRGGVKTAAAAAKFGYFEGCGHHELRWSPLWVTHLRVLRNEEGTLASQSSTNRENSSNDSTDNICDEMGKRLRNFRHYRILLGSTGVYYEPALEKAQNETWPQEHPGCALNCYGQYIHSPQGV
ncbi:uncharacterized protein A4U43_C01F8030 [Asparagus officinalis]|uniref:Uncharacterized protein n=1 Tax=Asparagus officinalis TaxID=4686 RepID=A0A5P1FSB7_ASPOF|nr:uncharacterized protein A4U43_C01F8030 [Asparagus officinalis]